jgi:hypothetical protein
MFVSGLFRCVDMDVVSMKFVYSELDMDLRLFIDASAWQAMDVLSKLGCRALCYCFYKPFSEAINTSPE